MKNCFENSAFCAQKFSIVMKLSKEMIEALDDAIEDEIIKTDTKSLLYLSRSLQNVIAHDFKKLSNTLFAEKMGKILSISTAITLLACEAGGDICEHMECLSQGINTNATFFLGKFKIKEIKGLL